MKLFQFTNLRDKKHPTVKTTVFTVVCGTDVLHHMIKQIEIRHFMVRGKSCEEL